MNVMQTIPLSLDEQPAGLRQKGNINLFTRPVVENPDGSISTVRSLSFGTDDGEVLIPTVTDDGRILDDEAAIEYFYQTGNHLGIFDTPEAATAFADHLHKQQEQYYGDKIRPASAPLPTP